MKVGAPFNPSKVFQGAFAPYWILEHRGISAGAKLCYIRLLGFAGKDARRYPSLETLGASLITVDQRGLRKTNLYLFLWTPELDQLLGCVPDRPIDPGNSESGPAGGRDTDRNTCSGPIGVNSEGNTSLESSSASEPSRSSGAQTAKVSGELEDERKNRTAWAGNRGGPVRLEGDQEPDPRTNFGDRVSELVRRNAAGGTTRGCACCRSSGRSDGSLHCG